jgi:hypothetical protein
VFCTANGSCVKIPPHREAKDVGDLALDQIMAWISSTSKRERTGAFNPTNGTCN